MGVEEAIFRDSFADELVVDLQPIASFTGVMIFGDLLEPTPLKLIDSKPLDENTARIRYQVMRDRIATHSILCIKSAPSCVKILCTRFSPPSLR